MLSVEPTEDAVMWLRDRAEQVIDAARFLSRLPLPQTSTPSGPLAATLRAAPIAGVLIGAGPALLLLVGSCAGLPSLAAAGLAVTALIVVTGGLHEDGLADVADGFGGGPTVSRKLSIMRDSRIGTYGTLALGAALLLRVAALQGLVEQAGAGAAALAMMAAAALSRGLMLLPLALLPPARPDGLARTAAPDDQQIPVAAVFVAGLLGALLAVPAVPDAMQILAGLLASGAAALGVTRLARHHVRGVTGDVIGAAQQAVEVLYLLMLCAAAGSR